MPYATVIKKGVFDAAHSNYGFGAGHKCARIHGHTFNYEVAVRSEIDKETGLSLDFGFIKTAMKKYVDDKLDHYYLNTLDEFKDIPPSAENIAIYIFNAIQNAIGEHGEVQYVKLDETPTSAVLIRKEDLE